MWLIHPNSINESQRGNLRASVRARCLVEVKTYGIRPRKLLKTISEKIEINMIVLPGLLVPSRVLNSLCRVDIRFVHRRDHREGIVQNRYGIRVSPRKVDSQFRDMLNTEERGSNLENRLVIIFNLDFCWC